MSSNPAILRGFIKGEQNAFKDVFQQFHHELKYFAMKIVGSPDVAEDVVIMSFHQVFQRHTQFDSLPQIRVYLYKTVKTTALFRMRTERNYIARNKAFAEEMEHEDNFEREQIQNQLLSEVFEAARKLPKKCQTVFFKLFLDGLEPREVAAQLGISLDTVQSHKQNAINTLRLHLLKRSFLLWMLMVLWWTLHRMIGHYD